MPKVSTSYYMINEVAGVSVTPEGDLVAANCETDEGQEFFAIAPEKAYLLAVALLAGAEACAYVRTAPADERSGPAFESRVQDFIDKTQLRLIEEMVASTKPQ
jgi:hypothetical protein